MTPTSTQELIDYMREHYPHRHNRDLAHYLNVSETKLRTLASKHGIRKSSTYKVEQHKALMAAKKAAYLDKIPDIELTEIEQNIIVGSLLGDGSLDPGPKRSLNAYYKENFGASQREYRSWKKHMLKRLDFKLYRNNQLNSPSHPIYTRLRQQFYPHGVKTITEENLALLTHPIGLACLYLDDGSLVMKYGNRRSNKYYIYPEISLSTHSFTKGENQLLCDHIKNQFGIQFIFHQHPDGHGFHIRIGESQEIKRFLDLIKPYVSDIKCMAYKLDLTGQLTKKKLELEHKFPNAEVSFINMTDPHRKYSKEEITLMHELHTKGLSLKEIASELNRSYWSVAHKFKSTSR